MTGPNEGTIAALLRHSTTAPVKRYSNLSPSHLKAAVEGVVGFGKVPAGHQAETGGTDKSEPASNETVTGTVTTGSAGERSNVEAAVKMEPAIRIERTTCGLRISSDATSDNVTTQETTTQPTAHMEIDGASLSCPGNSVVARKIKGSSV